MISVKIPISDITIIREQAGAELGQAQLKLEVEFTLIIYRFGLSRFGLESSFWMVKKLVRLYLQSRPALIFTPSEIRIRLKIAEIAI